MPFDSVSLRALATEACGAFEGRTGKPVTPAERNRTRWLKLCYGLREDAAGIQLCRNHMSRTVSLSGVAPAGARVALRRRRPAEGSLQRALRGRGVFARRRRVYHRALSPRVYSAHGSQRRRGCNICIPWRRVAATPRPRRGHFVETGGRLRYANAAACEAYNQTHSELIGSATDLAATVSGGYARTRVYINTRCVEAAPRGHSVGRVAATPRIPGGYSEAGSRRRRGYQVDIPWDGSRRRRGYTYFISTHRTANTAKRSRRA